jgi:hypothetical protein
MLAVRLRTGQDELSGSKGLVFGLSFAVVQCKQNRRLATDAGDAEIPSCVDLRRPVRSFQVSIPRLVIKRAGFSIVGPAGNPRSAIKHSWGLVVHPAVV